MATYTYDPPIYLSQWPDFYKVFSSHYVLHVNASKEPFVAVEKNGDELIEDHIAHRINTSTSEAFDRNAQDTLSRLLTLTNYE